MAWMEMGKGRRLLAAIGLSGAMLLGGCAYDDYGYGGVNVGAGYYGGGYDGYYQPGYYGGWYNDYYYPGNGYYVYDRGGKRYRWNDGQRAYWEGRRNEWRGRNRNGDGRGNANNNWRNDRMQVPPQQRGRPWRGPRPDGVTDGTAQRQDRTWRGSRQEGTATPTPPAASSQNWRNDRMQVPPQQQGRPWRNSRPRN